MIKGDINDDPGDSSAIRRQQTAATYDQGVEVRKLIDSPMELNTGFDGLWALAFQPAFNKVT